MADPYVTDNSVADPGWAPKLSRTLKGFGHWLGFIPGVDSAGVIGGTAVEVMDSAAHGEMGRAGKQAVAGAANAVVSIGKPIWWVGDVGVRLVSGRFVGDHAEQLTATAMDAGGNVIKAPFGNNPQVTAAVPAAVAVPALGQQQVQGQMPQNYWQQRAAEERGLTVDQMQAMNRADMAEHRAELASALDQQR
ncbi:MAG: hypothetical protein CMM94_08275 [Rickettsiales bacterium]|nr:hypothetical protein [Rickettsiales bacterium]